MAIELGKAYVQILPSAKGISGSIQKAIAPEALAAGKSAGRNIATAIEDSLSKAGSAMTKYITTPAMAAATAVTGLVGALGFKRLVRMDEARAKLKGLGIEGKQLEIVMESAKNAVTGTTFTLAEGVNVAAGALAAGVKEGKELERYIRIVGDAATGANAPIGEMAQIFNRIQGTGKITRNELDMIEYRLPGFSNALMKHVGAASQEAFFEMVRAGKVSAADVLDTMEDFAGGMSAAYAETWSGLKDNILANIGIIGEALLQGLFEDGKKGMAEFLQVLRESEQLKQWARDTGEKLRDIFGRIVETIKTLISWWGGLSDSTKNAILTMTGIAVVLGPVLVAMSKFITVVTTLINGFGMLKAAVSAFAGVMGAASAPVLAVIGAIAALIAIGVLLWKNWDTVKEKTAEIWNAIAEFLSGIWESIKSVAETVWNAIVNFLSSIWDGITGIFNRVLEGIKSTIEGYWNGIKDGVEQVWNGIATYFEGIWELIKNIFVGAFLVLLQLITGQWEDAKKSTEQIWNNIKNALAKIWEGIKNVFSGALIAIVGFIKTHFENAKQTINTIWNSIKNFLSSIVESIRNAISNGFQRMRETISGTMNSVRDTIQQIWNNILSFLRGINLYDIGRNIIRGMIDGIKSMARSAVDAVRGVVDDAIEGAKRLLGIRSPSRVFMQIGQDTGEGLELGLLQMGERVRKASEKIVAGTIIDGGVNVVGGVAAGRNVEVGTGDVIIHIQNMNVRNDEDIKLISRELHRLQQARARGMGYA